MWILKGAQICISKKCEPIHHFPCYLYEGLSHKKPNLFLRVFGYDVTKCENVQGLWRLLHIAVCETSSQTESGWIKAEKKKTTWWAIWVSWVLLHNAGPLPLPLAPALLWAAGLSYSCPTYSLNSRLPNVPLIPCTGACATVTMYEPPNHPAASVAAPCWADIRTTSPHSKPRPQQLLSFWFLSVNFLKFNSICKKACS